MKPDPTLPSTPSWGQVLLVCKDCRKRSNGPKKLRGKEVVGEARRTLREQKPRPRVLLTSCLGLCPKAALAVALVGGGKSEARMVGLTSLADVERLVAQLAA